MSTLTTTIELTPEAYSLLLAAAQDESPSQFLVRILAARQVEADAVMTFPLRRGTWDLPLGLARKLEAAYPQVDVPRSLDRALMWCEANPSKRKTATGMPAFLNRWMSSEGPAGEVDMTQPQPASITMRVLRRWVASQRGRPIPAEEYQAKAAQIQATKVR